MSPIRIACAVIALTFLVAPVPRADAVDFTLSDWALQQLDYDLSGDYEPDPTSEVLAVRDIPGPGVEFDIWYKSNTSWTDARFKRHSSSRAGAGTLVGLDVSAYEAFTLRFTLLAIDGEEIPLTDGWMTVGAVLGPTEGGHNWGYAPEEIGTAAGYPRSAISRTPVGSPIVEEIGITLASPPGEGWNPDGYVATVLITPPGGAVVIPEPTSLVVLLSSGALLMARRRRRVV